MFDDIHNIFRGGRKTKAPPAPPCPLNEFTHPENKSLFARFHVDSQLAALDKASSSAIDGYVPHAHPDLFSVLYDLIIDNNVRKGSVYGRPVMANGAGLIFAYAEGTRYIFLKLPEDRHGAALKDQGRFDPTYGKDWIQFRVGGRIEGRSDWREALRRWSRISYQDSLGIK